VSDARLKITYIGGPTALLEVGGLRFLTDPTFDPAGSEYGTASYVLRKTQGPALGPVSLGAVDAVLLNHDHHFDNLDTSGRSLLSRAARVLTTQAGAVRLGSGAVGLIAWQATDIPAMSGRAVRVMATPARHGPVHMDRGPVVGFVLTCRDQPGEGIYVSGDTVWYEDLREIGRRFSIRVALLFMGAARVAAVGPWHFTLTAAEGLEAARALAGATIVPLHYEGWAHFSESRDDIERAFGEAGLSYRLRWMEPAHPTEV
jgi:L-ascorbate metabolism protein UlaG (beta-lactamase superfamily)